MTIQELFKPSEINLLLNQGALYREDIEEHYSCKDEIYTTIRINYAYAYATGRAKGDSSFNCIFDKVMRLGNRDLINFIKGGANNGKI